MESAAPGAAAAAPQMVQDMCKFTDRPHHNIAYKRCPFYHVPEHCNHYRIASLHPPAYPVTATASRFPINRNSIWRRMRTEALRSVWVKRAPWMKRLCRTATYYLHTTSEKNQEASSKFVETKSWPSLKPETPPTCTNMSRCALTDKLAAHRSSFCAGHGTWQLVQRFGASAVGWQCSTHICTRRHVHTTQLRLIHRPQPSYMFQLQILITRKTSTQKYTNSPHFMEPERSLPHSQVPAKCSYP